MSRSTTSIPSLFSSKYNPSNSKSCFSISRFFLNSSLVKYSFVPCCNLLSPINLKSHFFSLFNFQTLNPSIGVIFSLVPSIPKGTTSFPIFRLNLTKSLSFSYSKLSLILTVNFSLSNTSITSLLESILYTVFPFSNSLNTTSDSFVFIDIYCSFFLITKEYLDFIDSKYLALHLNIAILNSNFKLSTLYTTL